MYSYPASSADRPRSRDAPLATLPRLRVRNQDVNAWRIAPTRVALAAAWLGAALAVAMTSRDDLVGVTMLAAMVGTTVLASEDQIGAAGLSGLFAPLSVLLFGWPAGVVMALGVVTIGDGFVRAASTRALVWHASLLAGMLTAGAWIAGAPNVACPALVVGRLVGLTWCGIFVAFAFLKARHGSPLTAVAQGGTMILVVLVAIAGPRWLPWLPGEAGPAVSGGLHGMGFAAAFMLVDFVAGSVVATRAAGPGGLAFWRDHLPVLFARYASQGAAAGVIVFWYRDSGPAALVAAVVVLLLLQAMYLLHRRADETVESAIAALASAIDARDPYTAGHSVRVAEYASLAAISLGWSKGRVALTQRAGLLHDVGKLGVADEVLHKPGVLSDAEFAHMKRHATVGEEIVGHIRGLGRVAAIVGQDHEHWSGSGYPRGLAGTEILPEARLIAIADVFDALTTERPYRGALSEEDALRHLEEAASRQTDPVLTAAFVKLVRSPRPGGVSFCYCATH